MSDYKLFLTSDEHYNHANVILYCNRPFHDINEMNREIRDRHNSIVGQRDKVIHVGDFAWGPKNLIPVWLSKLNGEHILVKGNHDRSAQFMLGCGFKEVHNELVMEINGFKVLITHRPPRKDRVDLPEYDYVLHGHVHERYRSVGKLINVGVDVWDFRPQTFDQLIIGIAPRSEINWDVVGKNKDRHNYERRDPRPIKQGS